MTSADLGHMKSSGLTSPVSLDMPLSDFQESKSPGGLAAISCQQDFKRPLTVSKKNEASSASQVVKADQLRQFAKQIFKKHVTQAKNLKSTTTSGGATISGDQYAKDTGQALSRVLAGLIKQQKLNSKPEKSHKKTGKRGGQQHVSERVKTNSHQRSANQGVILNTSSIVGAEGSRIYEKRSKSNPRQSTHQGTVMSLAGLHDSTGKNTTGLSTLNDGRNNNLISVMQKRRRAGVPTTR